MSEQRERRTKVLTKVNCYLEGANKKPVKVNKGMLVLMSDEEIDHFEGAVTKDIPKVKKGEQPLPEFKRG